MKGIKKSLKALVRAPFVLRARLRDRSVAKAPKFNLTACAIFREEAPFLAEWITFHRNVGFEHFYLYNNFSTDDFKTVLEPFIREGLVTLVDWPRPQGQISAYRDCIRRRWRDALWIALIDIDEFLFAPDGRDVPSVLKAYRDLPGVCVWQAFYGASGHVERPQGPVIEAYTMRAGPDIRTVKTIVNPRMVYKVHIHLCKFWSGEGKDTHRRTIQDTYLRILTDIAPKFDILRINHYWSRSLADLDRKIRRGDAFFATQSGRDVYFAFESKLNVERDEAILEAMRRAEAMRSIKV